MLPIGGEQRKHLDAGGPTVEVVVLVILLFAGKNVDDSTGESAVVSVDLRIRECPAELAVGAVTRSITDTRGDHCAHERVQVDTYMGTDLGAEIRE